MPSIIICVMLNVIIVGFIFLLYVCKWVYIFLFCVLYKRVVMQSFIVNKIAENVWRFIFWIRLDYVRSLYTLRLFYDNLTYTKYFTMLIENIKHGDISKDKWIHHSNRNMWVKKFSINKSVALAYINFYGVFSLNF